MQDAGLQSLLRDIFKQLIAKDRNNLFTCVSSQPDQEHMDLGRMAKRLIRYEYTTVGSFAYDFHLICRNCLAVSQPGSAEHRAAEKLQQLARCLLSPASLANLVRTDYASVSSFQLGFDINPRDEKSSRCSSVCSSTLTATVAVSEDKGKAAKERHYDQDSVSVHAAVPGTGTDAVERVKPMRRKVGQRKKQTDTTEDSRKSFQGRRATSKGRTRSSQSWLVGSSDYNRITTDPLEVASLLVPKIVFKVVVKETWLRPPPLSGHILTSLALSHLDPGGRNQVALEDIVAFITLHFPYYGGRQWEQCVQLVLGELAREGPNWKGRQLAAYEELKDMLSRDGQGVEASMREPAFLNTMMEGLLCVGRRNQQTTTKRPPPPLTDRELALLSLVSLKAFPATLAQLTLYLSHVFPAFWAGGHLSPATPTGILWRGRFLAAVAEVARESICCESGEARFQLLADSYRSVVTELLGVARARQPQLRAAIWDPSFIPVFFPVLPQRPNTLFVPSQPGQDVDLSLPVPPHPLPEELLLFSLFYLKKKQQTSSSSASPSLRLSELASGLIRLTSSGRLEQGNSHFLEQLAAFVQHSEAFELAVRADGDIANSCVSILPAAQLFGESLLMTSILHNLDEVSKSGRLEVVVVLGRFSGL